MSQRLFTRVPWFAALLFAGLPAHAGDFFFRPFNSDADSTISSTLQYTALADLNGDGSRTINGVQFLDSQLSGTNYTLVGPDGAFTAFANTITGSASSLISDFFFGSTVVGPDQGNASLTLSGLTVGQKYVTTWYNAAFGGPNGRNITITASDTNRSVFFDQNFSGAGNGNLLRYAFTATAPTITYTFDADGNGDSFHHYAFSNALQSAAFSTPVITTQTGAAPLSPFTPSSTDLLQTKLSGVTSGGNFTQETSGGIPILNDGIFTLNGGGAPADTRNLNLATGANNSFVVFTLDTSVNTLGYDISSIETYGGWHDNGRDRQSFQISISLAGSDAFIDFGSINFDPTLGTTTSIPTGVRAVFPATLSGVDAIRFDFPTNQENTYAGYGEFDVIGTATIPEPTAALIGLFGGAATLLRRRRR
ncbi:MAG TPA: hypothetical protein VFG14_10095 [Chthoniobacteraceae bacterium]|nr:hypothetical protein [Chthoniobacteraceae bacterium]